MTRTWLLNHCFVPCFCRRVFLPPDALVLFGLVPVRMLLIFAKKEIIRKQEQQVEENKEQKMTEHGPPEEGANDNLSSVASPVETLSSAVLPGHPVFLHPALLSS